MKAPVLAVAFLAVLAALPPAAPAAPVEAPTTRGVAAGLGFEPNLGQWSDGVRYAVNGAPYAAWLLDDGAIVLVDDGARAVAVRTVFEGARAAAPFEALADAPGRTHYLRGDDPEAWIRGVPQHAAVAQRGTWPGVDVVWHADPEGRLEFDLHVAPGADLAAARLRFAGADAPRVVDGALVVPTLAGDLVHPAPVAWLEDGTPVAVAYDVGADGSVGFVAAPYDGTRTLVVDPVVEVATYVGGSAYDRADGVAADADGNAYVFVRASSRDVPTTPGLQPAHAGGYADALVSKFAPDGTLLWRTFLGGSDREDVGGVDVAPTGEVLVVGNTYSADFPVVDAAQPAIGGDIDAFVARLSPEGDALVVSTFLGGAGFDVASPDALVALPGGGALVALVTTSTLPAPGGHQPAPGGAYDGYVARLTPALAVERATYFGGSGWDAPRGVAVAPDGDVLVAGSTGSTDLALDRPVQGDDDAFVARFSPDLATRRWATAWGGVRFDRAEDVGVRADGTVFASGFTASPDAPMVGGGHQPVMGGGPCPLYGGTPCLDAFLLAYAADGTLVRSTYLGWSGSEYGGVLEIATDGSVWVAGRTGSRDAPVVDAVQRTLRGFADPYLARVAADGSGLLSLTYLGGDGSNPTTGSLALAPDGDVLVTAGEEHAVATRNAAQPTYAGGTDGVFYRVSDRRPGQPTDPDPPRGRVGLPGQVDLAWTPPPDDGGAPVERYRVYRVSGPGAERLVGETTGTSFRDDVLLEALGRGAGATGTFAWRVSAVNAHGEGTWSNVLACWPYGYQDDARRYWGCPEPSAASTSPARTEIAAGELPGRGWGVFRVALEAGQVVNPVVGTWGQSGAQSQGVLLYDPDLRLVDWHYFLQDSRTGGAFVSADSGTGTRVVHDARGTDYPGHGGAASGIGAGHRAERDGIYTALVWSGGAATSWYWEVHADRGAVLVASSLGDAVTMRGSDAMDATLNARALGAGARAGASASLDVERALVGVFATGVGDRAEVRAPDGTTRACPCDLLHPGPPGTWDFRVEAGTGGALLALDVAFPP